MYRINPNFREVPLNVSLQKMYRINPNFREVPLNVSLQKCIE